MSITVDTQQQNMDRRTFLGKTPLTASLLGFTFWGGNVQLQRDQNLNSNWIIKNVKEFGAIGDGISDDTEAFQSALDQKGIIFIPNGNYLCRPIFVRSNSRLIGESKRLTIITSKERNEYLGVLNLVGEINNYLEDIIVENITVDGNKEDLYQGNYSHNIEALEVKYAKDFILRNIHAKNAIADGIDIDASEDFIVEGCSAENCGKYGLHVTREQHPDNIKCQRGIVRDCRWWNNGNIEEHRGGGMDTIHSENMIIDSCIAYNNFRGFTFYPGIAEPNKNIVGHLISYDNHVEDMLDGVLR